MAELKIKTGTKMKMAYDCEKPDFVFVTTFNKSLDESAFLVSIPLKDGKALQVGEDQKLLFRYGVDNNESIIAGYVDDIVKQGIKRFWKVRRVTEMRSFIQRADERIKVNLPVKYLNPLWKPNAEGVIEKEQASTLDISAGGLAINLNDHFDVGEAIEVDLPNVGSGVDGIGPKGITAIICWTRDAPKGSLYRHISGVQFRFGDDGAQREMMQNYVGYTKKKFKL